MKLKYIMKEFKQTKEELFVCEECHQIFKNRGELSKHINRIHFNIKKYYDKWILEENENKCKICDKEAKYSGGLRGYKNFCDRICAVAYNAQQRKKYNIEKFGSKSPFGNKDVREKSKQTMLKKYGVKHFTNPEKTKQTCLGKYGVDNGSKTKETKKKIKNTHLKNHGVEYPMQLKENKEKSKKTCLDKYGVEYSFNSNEVKEKRRKTMIKKYGVEYSAQNKKIFEKQQKSRLDKKQFKDTNVYYQGSYELDFLEKYYDKYPDIKRGPRIKYVFEGKEHYYFSDFLIYSKNLIIECKNSYLAKRDKEKIKAKEKATISNGFNYIMIINKNYENFT